MKSSERKLVTGIKPTGKLHIGNYLGAIKPFLDIHQKYDSIIFIADLHALTSQSDAKALSRDILDIAVDYLALGIDPEKTLIFKQSDVPEIAEIAWIFNCITTMPYLMRAHAYKDAKAKNKEINVGVFDYPVLMAADILIQDADVVPVGFDQKQHVEYARDTAEKFNRIFGDTFTIPKPLILENTKTVPGTDGRKMSKSYKNTIELFAENDDIKKAVMGIPTDSKGIDEPKDPNKDNVFNLIKFFAEPKEIKAIRKKYEEGNIGYKESKEILIENLIKFIAPLREQRKKILEDKNRIKEILEKGGRIAGEKAKKKMEDVRLKVGLR